MTLLPQRDGEQNRLREYDRGLMERLKTSSDNEARQLYALLRRLCHGDKERMLTEFQLRLMGPSVRDDCVSGYYQVAIRKLRTRHESQD
jgi:hypothetical protein